MTQLRKFRDAISNYFDEIERGIGPMGSTFTDVDAISHDAPTKRFLFREFKNDTEVLDKAQRWTLDALAGVPRCTVWFLRRRDDGLIGWAQFPDLATEELISVAEYQARLRRWWDNVPVVEALDSSDVNDDRWIEELDRRRAGGRR